MNKPILAIAILLTIFNSQLKGQSIKITSYYSAQCAGNKMNVYFSSEGLTPSTTLTVELAINNTNNFFPVKTQRSGDTLQITLPSSINLPANYNAESYDMRIVSSSPRVVSASQYLSIYDKIQLSLSGELLSNPYQRISLEPEVKGSKPYSVSFTDGTTLNSQDYLIVSPKTTTTYTPVSVVNACGEGKVSGSQTVKVQPIDLRISSTNLPGSYCKGSFFYVNIIRSSAFNANNKFVVQCRGYNGTYQNCPTTAVNDTLLRVQVPTETTIEQIHSLRVLATDPVIVSRDFNIISLLYNHFIDTVKIFPGYNQQHVLSVDGLVVGKSKYTFSNGEVYTHNWSESSDFTFARFTLAKIQIPKTYTLISAEDACGVVPLKGSNLSATTPSAPAQSIFLTARQIAFCKGVKEPITIPVAFVNNVEDNGDFQVKFFLDGIEATSISGARLSADKKSVIADFPTEFYKRFENSTYYNYFYAKVMNPAYNIESAPFYIGFNTPANGSICCDATIQRHETVNLGAGLTGGGPYTIELSDGSKHTYIDYFSSIKVNPTKTTDYSIKRISNACGEGTVSQSVATVRVLSPTDFNIQLNKLPFNSICAGSSFDINFETLGTPPANTKYKVELYSRNSGHVLNLGTGTGSPINVTIPTDTNAYGLNGSYDHMTNRFIRVSTEDGTIISNEYQFLVKTTPKASIYRASPKYGFAPITASIQASVDISLSGGEPYYWSFNNEPEELAASPEYFYSENLRGIITASKELSFQSPGQYLITSVRNECGIGTMTGSPLVVQPFALEFTSPNHNIGTIHCLGGVYPISYTLFGPNSDAPLKVQLAKEGKEFFDVEVVKQGNPIWVKYPENLEQATSYQIRLKAQDYDVISPIRYISFYPFPSATMSTEYGESVGLVDNLQNGYSCIKIKANTNYWEAWVDNATSVWGSTSKEGCFTVYPKEGTIYTLKKIMNGCGYADINKNNSVEVDFKPRIQINNQGIYACSNGSFKLNFEAIGRFDQGGLFFVELISNDNKSWILRGQPEKTFNGDIQLPTGLKEGAYTIKVSGSSSFMGISNTTILYLTGKASAEIIDGSTTINPGQIVIIPIKVTGNTGGAQLNFNNGSTIGLYDNPTYLSAGFTKTTVLELKSITNACGVEPAKGKFTINVNPVSKKKISAYTFTYTVCKGDKLLISFESSGLADNAKYQAQISDDKGENFKNISTETIPDRLNAVYGLIPEDIKEGSGYRFRVIIPGDNEAQSGATSYPITIKDNFTATISYQKAYYTPEEPAEIKFDLTGQAPWRLSFTDTTGKNRNTVNINQTPYILKLKPINNNNIFKVEQISNSVCSNGILKGEHTFRIEVLTATENEAVPVIIYPNPTEKTLRIDAQVAIEKVSITDMAGKLLRTISKDNYQDTIDLSDFPAATFIVEVFVKNQSYKYKIVKL